jgi:hypothetical protein
LIIERHRKEALKTGATIFFGAQESFLTKAKAICTAAK